MAKQDWKSTGYMEQSLPKSKDERRQKAVTLYIVLFALAVLGIGAALRFTVFADRFRPTPFTAPTEVASPSPSPSPEAEVTP
jgi:cytoskeletal protein RodZ